ncbi:MULTISPECIES: antitoxin [Gluconobacter]|uniref:antitoxin n=1 Tax=Gluconobacter TaxID=441 RepID=UPI001B8BD665|nr:MULTISPECIES: type II toxin-antitoxin system VapB family antitoxin [Gluconobacter]MBS1029566.1 AbrB/MazE/SpoVT family DNA-binding domain-containing protein [Gluconobacter albidus]MBS1053727.1 AbrB/MazE/SpoVT family DNA-binding domain-containing protein [Gluconobacter kondonii]MBS1058115.1 AbrB/MazE/SpoVT family DNA-binding domain-containing protein [Gluconobacter kondonii]MCP1274497.1 type II toxin-antitoxin system VapB family antitoxin [Gluconobacter albidus]
MSQSAKLFNNGRSQAVRLPAAFRFEGTEVFIRRDDATGDVILSPRPDSWDHLIARIREGAAPNDFLSEAERHQEATTRDPFAGIDG